MKKLVFFGYGLTTRAIARKFGGGYTFYDDKTTEPRTDKEGNTILPSSSFDPDNSEMEILTPSIRPDNPLLKKAKNPVSEYDFFLGRKEEGGRGRDIADLSKNNTPQTYSLLPTPYSLPDRPLTIWISGTNGKTTTTQMLTHLLSKRGAVSGGNIGTPLADLDPSAPIWILETSSYTLHHTHTASPDIYLLLPVTPDHIDWHGSVEAYETDKLRPLLTMEEGELALVPKGLNLPETNAWVVEYDFVEFLAEFFDIDPSRIDFRAAFLEDAILALSVTRTLFDEVDYDLMNSFVMDKHRQEEFTDSRGRLWVNDSKATNVDATIQALNAYSDRPVHLVIGGDDKGVDLTPLMDRIADMNITIYTIGSNNDKLIEMALARSISAHSCHDLANAVKKIYSALDSDEVALLSPAASSLDQFPAYTVRGDTFIDTVKSLDS